MALYECISSFPVNVVDDNGFFTDKEKIIEKGTTWETAEDEDYSSDIRLYGDEEIYLDGSITLPWIDIDIDDLEKDFKIIN